MTDRKNNDGIFDMLDKAVNFYEENKDMIQEVAPSGNSVKIDDKSPLREAIVSDDKVMIVVEVKGDGFSNIIIDDTEDGVVVGMNDEKVVAEVPDDVNVDQAGATLNNGVLEVTIPRNKEEE